MTSPRSPSTVDWSPLERGGADTAALVPHFKDMETYPGNPLGYHNAVRRLVTQLGETKADARRAAAAVALPFLYWQTTDAQMQYNRSLPLVVVGALALGRPDDYVPHGLVAAAPDVRAAHALVAPTVVPRVLPLLADDQIAVRSQAAFLLGFFPAEARDAATPRLLDMVEHEQRAEPRLTAMVAAAMLQRGGGSLPDRAAREAFVAQLTERCARARAFGAGHTEADVADFGLAVARCVLGVHALADVQLLLRVGTVAARHLHDIPRIPDKYGEAELPLAPLQPPIPLPAGETDPPLAPLAHRVLAHLPGPGPEPTPVVLALADALEQTPFDNMPSMVHALLRSACGVRPDDSNAVPAPWPAYTNLDDRMGAAVRALARQEPLDILFLRFVLQEWHLPTSYRGFKKYIAGKRPAEEPDRSDKSCCCIQ